MGIFDHWIEDLEPIKQRDLETGKRAIEILRRLVNHPKTASDDYGMVELVMSAELDLIIKDAQTLVGAWDKVYHL